MLDFLFVDVFCRIFDIVLSEDGFVRVFMSDDVIVLEYLVCDVGIFDMVNGKNVVEMLWDVCKIFDYWKIVLVNYVEFLSMIYIYLRWDNVIEDDWFVC